MLHQRKLF